MAGYRSEYKKNKKLKKRLNIGIIVCVLILIYLVVYFCIYFFGTKVSLFEVTEGTTSNKFEGQFNALILREENVISAEEAGYINFFVGDSVPIYVGQKTCVIDPTGQISARMEEAAKNQMLLTDENLKIIKNTIFDFDTSYNPINYYDTYSFKYKVESQMLDLINSRVFESINEEYAELGLEHFTIVSSSVSGTISHNTDGYETMTEDGIEAASFNKTSYSKHIIKTNDLIDAGDPIYKVITSEKWKLIFQINNPDLFEGCEKINIQFLKDNITTSAPFHSFTKAGNTYGVLELKKYMIRYLSDRFLQIQLLDNVLTGLKIPKTALTEKQFYSIPVEYLTQGGNSSNYGFNKQVINSDGSTSILFVTPSIIKRTDEYVYISTESVLAEGDVLVKNESDSKYQIGVKENLQGVYVVDSGNAVFRIAEVIGENNNYYIVKENVSGGVRLYDQIVEDASSTRESDVINR